MKARIAVAVAAILALGIVSERAWPQEKPTTPPLGWVTYGTSNLALDTSRIDRIQGPLRLATAGAQEVLSIAADGTIKVRGKTATDAEVANALREWARKTLR